MCILCVDIGMACKFMVFLSKLNEFSSIEYSEQCVFITTFHFLISVKCIWVNAYSFAAVSVGTEESGTLATFSIQSVKVFSYVTQTDVMYRQWNLFLESQVKEGSENSTLPYWSCAKGTWREWLLYWGFWKTCKRRFWKWSISLSVRETWYEGSYTDTLEMVHFFL